MEQAQVRTAEEAGDQEGQQVEEKNEMVMVDIEDLVPSKDNFYHVDTDLKRSIELVGVLQPLLVKKPENGKYKVIAGHRRRLAVMELVKEGKEKFRFLPCVFKKETVMDRLAIIMANRFREKTDWEKMMEAIEAEELAKELKKEYQMGGRTRELLSEITGIAQAQLGRYKAIYNNLLPELMEEFKNNTIMVSVAVELSGMEEEIQRKAADIMQSGGILSLPEVKEMKRQAEEEAQIPGQMEFEIKSGYQNPLEDTGKGENKAEKLYRETEENATEEAGESRNRLCKTGIDNGECSGKKTHESGCMEHESMEKYRDSQLGTISSPCYSCNNDETCNNSSDGKAKLYEIIITAGICEAITSGKLTFLLLKKDCYKEGEEIMLIEYEKGTETGRKICVAIQYIWQDWTGLDNDYCIIGFSLKKI